MADDIARLLEGFRNDIVSHVDSSEERLRDEIRSARAEAAEFRREVFAHFDGIYARFDKLESE